MLVSKAAVAWSPVRSHRAMLPAPTRTTDGIGVVLANSGALGPGSEGAVGPESSRQVLMRIAPAMTSGTSTLGRGPATRIGWRRGVSTGRRKLVLGTEA